MKKYCYHITNGTTRSALVCGTVTASSMEEAAIIAAQRAKLTAVTTTDVYGWSETRWTKDGERRSVHVLHDPEPYTP